ncbi:MAG: hypothetical protein ACI8XB_002050 [Patiriisocius sp.]|jgi:hypothetical protein
MKRAIILITLILSSHFMGAQNYFFEFVDGWINNYGVEHDNGYLFLGMGTTFGTNHWYIYNELDQNGELIDQNIHQVDSVLTLSSRVLPQMAVSLDDNNLIIVGIVEVGEDEFKGTLTNYNIDLKEFELLSSYDHVLLDALVMLNDTTLIVAGDRIFPSSMNLNSSLYNMDMEGNIRWETSFSCGFLCQRWPVQILPLSNGNIAFLMDEYDGDYPWDSRREKAVLVVVDEEGEILWEEYPGDEDGFRIWAGGMVEVDGEIMVSYTQRFFYNSNGEWIHNDENTFYLEKYLIDDGFLTWSHDFSEQIQYGIDENIPGAGHRIRQMQMLDDGNVLISGTSGIMGLVAKITTSGELLWHHPYAPHQPLWMTEGNATEFTEIYCVTPVSDGGFIMAGQYDSSPSSLYPGGIQTAIAIKVDQYGCLEEDCQVGIEEYKEDGLSIYPNPSNGRFVVELPVLRLRSATFALSVIDALGVTVFSRYDVRGDEIEIDLSVFSDGVYFVRLNTEDRIFKSKIIKQ